MGVRRFDAQFQQSAFQSLLSGLGCEVAGLGQKVVVACQLGKSEVIAGLAQPGLWAGIPARGGCSGWTSRARCSHITDEFSGSFRHPSRSSAITAWAIS